MKKLYGKPRQNFELSGTKIRVSTKKWYPVYIADNIPLADDGITRYWLKDLLLRENEIILKITG